MCLPAARQISIGLRTQRDPSGGVGVSLSHQALRLLENWSQTKTVVPDEAKRVARGADATRASRRGDRAAGEALVFLATAPPATVPVALRPPTWPARSDTIRAAEAQVEAARAALPQAEWELAQKTRQVPEDAMVVDTFFEPGEWVAAGRPSLLPPGNIKVRFYVPEEALGTLAIGDPLELRCDHCPEDLRVEVSYISAEAEYTPPVIYSRETRDKLVYRIEARPDLRADAHYALHALIHSTV